MAEDIISVAVRRLINEIDHALFDEEQWFLVLLQILVVINSGCLCVAFVRDVV
jgi:hypothetical protein